MIAFLRGPDFKMDMAKNVGTVLRYRWPYGKHEFHPSEKPVDLCECLIGWTSGVVLDPFAGSGTTLRAAKNMGREAVGIEIEESLCEVAATRLQQNVLFV